MSFLHEWSRRVREEARLADSTIDEIIDQPSTTREMLLALEIRDRREQERGLGQQKGNIEVSDDQQITMLDIAPACLTGHPEYKDGYMQALSDVEKALRSSAAKPTASGSHRAAMTFAVHIVKQTRTSFETSPASGPQMNKESTNAD